MMKAKPKNLLHSCIEMYLFWILEREAPLAISNVMYVCPVTQKPTRVGIRKLEDGRRARFSKKSNETFE